MSRSCRTGSKARGFTLLELLVVVAVSAALIALLGLVYRQVQRTGQGLGAAESDWQVQVFLRRQIAARDERFDPLALNEGDTTSLRLVSRYSAAHAMAGPPVLAHYLFLPNQERLVYRETPLPPWWTDGQSAVAFRSATLANATLTSNEQVLLARHRLNAIEDDAILLVENMWATHKDEDIQAEWRAAMAHIRDRKSVV